MHEWKINYRITYFDLKIGFTLGLKILYRKKISNPEKLLVVKVELDRTEIPCKITNITI